MNLYHAPAVPEKVESPDREEFERQAKYQGITDFSLNQNGFRTYANDVAEFAWRLWANKNSPVYKSMLSAAPTPPTNTSDSELREAARAVVERWTAGEYGLLEDELDRLRKAL